MNIIQYNAWVYYVGLALCAFIAIVVFALQDRYSIATFGDYAEYNEAMSRRTRTVRFLTMIMIGYLVFWASIRNGVVDTPGYIRAYIDLDTNIDVWALFQDDDEKAPLFVLFQVVLKKLGFNWSMYLATVAIISGYCIYYGISKYSDDVALSCYIFISSTEFYWLFNGIRQFLVVALFFALFRLVVEKKLIKFLIFVFVMYFIHSTAIVLIPIYFIANMKNWSLGISACILTTMAVVLIFPDQINLWIDEAFMDYGYLEAVENDDGVNIFRVAVALVTPILAFFYRKEIKEYNNPFINTMVNMSLITAGVYAVANVTSGIFVGRLPIYTETFNILLLPFIINRIVPKRIKPILYFCCIVGFFFFFHLQFRNSGAYTTFLFDSMNYNKDIPYCNY